MSRMPVSRAVAAAAIVSLVAHAGSALAAPSLLSLNPSTGDTTGGITLTLNGTSFSPSGNTVKVDGEDCLLVGPESTVLLRCTVPEGTGATNDVVVTDALGDPSNARNFAYNAPSLSSVTPTTVPTAGATITLNGNNFGPPGSTAPRSVMFGSAACTVVPGSFTHGTVECDAPEGQGLNQPVTVFIDGQASLALPVSYSPPRIDSIEPAAGGLAAGTRLTIRGENFGVSPSVVVGGGTCTVAVRSHTEIECDAPAGMDGTTAVFAVVGGQVSNMGFYEYVGPPSISSVVPSAIPTAGNVPITINGTNFASTGNVVEVGGAPCTVNTEESSKIVCDPPEGTGLDAEVVVTAYGQTGTPSTVDYAPPVIDFLEPGAKPTAGNISLTLRGNNFGPPSADAARSVVIGGSPCPLVASSSDHDKVVCTLPVGQGTGFSVVVGVSGQTSNSGTLDYDPPSISSITPERGATAGSYPLTINGTNFGTSATVTVGGNACPLSLQGHEQLVCTAPAGSSLDSTVTVLVSGQFDTTLFDYADPSCGDGFLEGDEDCDDGDADDYDGCSAGCDVEDAQDGGQAGCILALNKAASKVAAAQQKDVAACAKAASGAACVGASVSAGLQKAFDKTAAAFDKKCATTPDFGPTSVATTNDPAADQPLDLAADLFGTDVDGALAPDAMAPGRPACQQAVLGAAQKLASATHKAFGKCKKTGLGDGTIVATSQLARCLATAASDAKVTKLAASLGSAFDARCASESVADAFPGDCAAATDLPGCVEDRVRCRTCLALSSIDALDADCDLHDDAAANASCP